MAVFKMKDPESWLPSWAVGRSLAALKVKLFGRTIDVPLDKQHGGYDLTVTDPQEVTLMRADPRWEEQP